MSNTAFRTPTTGRLADMLVAQSSLDAANEALLSIAAEEGATVRFQYIKESKRTAGDLIPEVRTFAPQRIATSAKGNVYAGGMDIDREEYHNYSIASLVGVIEFNEVKDRDSLNRKLIALAAMLNSTVEFNYHKGNAPQVRTFMPAEVRCSKADNWTGWGWDVGQARPSYFSTNLMSDVRFVEVGVVAPTAQWRKVLAA